MEATCIKISASEKYLLYFAHIYNERSARIVLRCDYKSSNILLNLSKPRFVCIFWKHWSTLLPW